MRSQSVVVCGQFGLNVKGLFSLGGRRVTLTAEDAKCGFRRLIDMARAEPVKVAKHGRPVVVVMAVEEFERLRSLDRSGPNK
ncbi:MAG: type II toxin-antitoxin system prevent-host-death family antitoxin [Candidatus Binataceae bacterium]